MNVVALQPAPDSRHPSLGRLAPATYREPGPDRASFPDAIVLTKDETFAVADALHQGMRALSGHPDSGVGRDLEGALMILESRLIGEESTPSVR